MNRKFKLTIIMTSISIVFTIIVNTVDIQPIGPKQSVIALASLNQYVFQVLKTNTLWYTITNWLGYIAIGIALGFACYGLFQLMSRKSIKKVDIDIVNLGIIYSITGVIYILFETFIINYRPILMNGVLEASYPSSHTMLAIVIFATSIIQCNKRINDKKVHRIITSILTIFIIITIIGRILSGVHWFSDIIGSILISTTLVLLYDALIQQQNKC